MTTREELTVAVAAGRFTSMESAILGAALQASEPWSGYALLQRIPECGKTPFYRAFKRLRARRIIRQMPGAGKPKWQIGADYTDWKNRAGDAPLFAEGTPERLGLSRRMEGNRPGPKTRRKPKRITRVRPTRVETETRAGTDDNDDLPRQQHLTDANGTDLDRKELDPWDKMTDRLKAAHRKP